MWVSSGVGLMLLAGVSLAALDLNQPLERDEVIDAVNSAHTTWKAGRNFDPTLKRSYLKHLMGVLPSSKSSGRLPQYKPPSNFDVRDLPAKFDARNHWKKQCSVIKEVRDQGPCGSCWAVAAAAAFSDRLCIATSGQINTALSAEQLVSCCRFCGYGCNGGSPDLAWSYFKAVGLVTGGGYQSDEGCQPYSLPACEHHANGTLPDCSTIKASTPKCRRQCTNANYTTRFSDDLHKVKSSFVISKEADIQQELYTNGPLEAAFSVYEDFVSYKSGVYQYTSGSLLGGHAVKLLGWGTEAGTPYWLVANNWNTDWGDQGLFKIKRGSDECGFESDVTGGIPAV